MSFIDIEKLDGHELAVPEAEAPEAHEVGGSAAFWASKYVFDVVMALMLLPIVLFCALVLVVLNPFYNKGSLFYVQPRMGKDCRAFKAIKFRTMVPARVERGPDDPIETHRITRLGHFLRKTRIDELPQIFNVLLGDMSLIGPRPDYFNHARSYLRTIPEYRARHAVRPGISGLAQVQLGYIEGVAGTRAKARADLQYIRNAGFWLDWRIFWATLATVISRKGT